MKKDYIENKIQELGKYADARKAFPASIQDGAPTIEDYKVRVNKNAVRVFVDGYQIATFSRGNDKIQSKEHVNFLIWNVAQIITCPGATKGCLSFCYADKMYNNIQCWDGRGSAFGRVRNTVASFAPNFEEVFNAAISALKKKEPNKPIFVRLHESGDVYSAEYLQKLENVVKTNAGIHFLIFTKTTSLLPTLDRIQRAYNNFSVRVSLDDTTEAPVLGMVLNAREVNTAGVVDPADYDKVKDSNAYICNAPGNPGKCAQCLKCWNKKYKNVIFLKH